jgi:hypothetical protein
MAGTVVGSVVQATVPLWEVELQPRLSRGFLLSTHSTEWITCIKLRQYGPRLWTAKNFRQHKSREWND